MTQTISATAVNLRAFRPVYNKSMNSIANIIGPTYRKLLSICEQQKIALNLDLTNPSLKIRQEDKLKAFLKDTLTLAIKNCKRDNKITIAQSITDENKVRFSIKYDGNILEPDQKAALLEKEYEVRSRFGYGNTISIDIR